MTQLIALLPSQGRDSGDIKASYGSCTGYFYIDNYGKLICPVRKSRSRGVKNILNFFHLDPPPPW